MIHSSIKKHLIGMAVIGATFSASIMTTALAANVTVIDKTMDPAANFLAYTEFELSGEPLAESLGLDLDMLDANIAGAPTLFDYAAGIESYEYSEEAMYALNYRSTMGIHLVNGPLNASRGGVLKQLSARINLFADAVGLNQNEVPKNIYPLSLPFTAGTPEFAQKVDITPSNDELIDVITISGDEKTLTTVTPAYVHDYETLAWDQSSFDTSLTPAAIGGIFLKEVMWAQDFLGGMHVTSTDEELDADSSKMDTQSEYSLGVSAADGFNGLMLTEMSIDKLLFMQENLGFDGKHLGVAITPDYNPVKTPIWFPHNVAVNVTQKHHKNAIQSLSINDGKSTLRDTWQMLWPLAEFYAFSDQRTANNSKNPALLAVFDGQPFSSTPIKNSDNNANNDVKGTDAFSLASNLSHFVFSNLSALHFNKQHGTFVDSYKNKKQGDHVNTYDAAYSIVALSIYQRAKDALPVGYASADSGNTSLETLAGKQALSMITAQADFIIKHLINNKGLVADGVNISTNKVSGIYSLDSQFAAIRGLVAAFLATHNDNYRNVARNLFLAVEKYMFDAGINTWASIPGQSTIHTPYTAAAISGGLRETILHLHNEEGENEAALEIEHLTNRYVSWFNGIINGGMQLAEPIGDTGELVIKGSNLADNDNDGVKQIIAAGGTFGTAAVMANKVSVNK